MSIEFKIAGTNDIWPLMALYQKIGSTFTEDPLFLSYQKMEAAIAATDSIWILAFNSNSEDKVLAALSILLDRKQGMAKITRMMVNPEDKDPNDFLRKTIRYALNFLYEKEKDIEVIYSTTLSLPLQLQTITLLEGFQILGVFPNATGVDLSKLNGLTVHYKNGVLENRRQKDLEIHPSIEPFFKLAQNSLNLEKVRISQNPETSAPTSDFESLPPLELIKAPLLVANKLKKIKENQSVSVNFFPFLNPNALIVDPDETIQVYVRIVNRIRFAAVIGEHLQRSVDPVKLYEQILILLRAENITYVEVINDAGDVYGTECFLKAGFTPSAYMPAFKSIEQGRRDYVVLTRSFEYFCRPAGNIPKGYLDFFREYWKLERRNYFNPSQLLEMID